MDIKPSASTSRVIKSKAAQRGSLFGAALLLDITTLARLLTNLYDFDAHQILPVFQPYPESREICRLHQLKTSVTVFLKPAIQIHQPFRQHPALRIKSVVDFLLAPRKKSFDHHVLLHMVPVSDEECRVVMPQLITLWL